MIMAGSAAGPATGALPANEGAQPPARILCVDDEPNVLQALSRTLRRHVDVVTAESGADGLLAIQRSGPFAVVVSDLRMPGMDGIAFLREVRKAAPDASRVLLTGNADLTSAIAAVNEGAVFRFLMKPASQEHLLAAITAAQEQHRLVTAERVLLEQTLHGSIKALTDVLAMVNPAGFGRALRAKQLVQEFQSILHLPSPWQVEVAALLSQIGTVLLPPVTVERLYRGDVLSREEESAVARLPHVANQIIAHIPRLDDVRHILTHLGARYDGDAALPGVPAGKALPLGARLLTIVFDLDLLESRGLSRVAALEELEKQTGRYDPALLQTLMAGPGWDTAVRLMEVELRDLRAGMSFAQDLRGPNDVLLVARGQDVTDRLVARIELLIDSAILARTVRVIVPDGMVVPGAVLVSEFRSTVE